MTFTLFNKRIVQSEGKVTMLICYKLSEKEKVFTTSQDYFDLKTGILSRFKHTKMQILYDNHM